MSISSSNSSGSLSSISNNQWQYPCINTLYVTFRLWMPSYNATYWYIFPMTLDGKSNDYMQQSIIQHVGQSLQAYDSTNKLNSGQQMKVLEEHRNERTQHLEERLGCKGTLYMTPLACWISNPSPRTPPCYPNPVLACFAILGQSFNSIKMPDVTMCYLRHEYH